MRIQKVSCSRVVTAWFVNGLSMQNRCAAITRTFRFNFFWLGLSRFSITNLLDVISLIVLISFKFKHSIFNPLTLNPMHYDGLNMRNIEIYYANVYMIKITIGIFKSLQSLCIYGEVSFF